MSDEDKAAATTVKEAAQALNAAIAAAAARGIRVEVEALASTMMRSPHEVPIVQVLLSRPL